MTERKIWHERLWGPQPSDEEIDWARRKNDEMLKEVAIEAINASCESGLFAHELGISVEDLWRLGEEGKVAEFAVGSMKFYPKWQVYEGQLLDGISDVVKNFPYKKDSEFATWGTKPSVNLDGRTPAQALLDGDLSSVITLIQAQDPTL